MPIPLLTCEYCEAEYDLLSPERPTERFCSEWCEVSAWYDRWR